MSETLPDIVYKHLLELRRKNGFPKTMDPSPEHSTGYCLSCGSATFDARCACDGRVVRSVDLFKTSSTKIEKVVQLRRKRGYSSNEDPNGPEPYVLYCTFCGCGHNTGTICSDCRNTRGVDRRLTPAKKLW